MVDVLDMPSQSFGYVPTPALVAPIEFTMRLTDYRSLGGHMDHVQQVEDINSQVERRLQSNSDMNWPMDQSNFHWGPS